MKPPEESGIVPMQAPGNHSWGRRFRLPCSLAPPPPREPRTGLAGRWFKFQAVGAFGIVVQMVSLAFFHRSLGWSVMAATAAAVEVAILHNFVWHVRWTWGDASRHLHVAAILHRLWQYNLTYSLVSISTNLYFTSLYMHVFGLHYLLANLFAIATGGLANFIVGEFLVFRPTSLER